MASSSSSKADTRVIPMLEPPRAGLTNTGQPSRVTRHQHPPPVGGDADGQHLVAVVVDGRQDQARARAGHGVLGAAAAEHHGDPDLFLPHASSRLKAERPGYGLLRDSRATYA